MVLVPKYESRHLKMRDWRNWMIACWDQLIPSLFALFNREIAMFPFFWAILELDRLQRINLVSLATNLPQGPRFLHKSMWFCLLLCKPVPCFWLLHLSSFCDALLSCFIISFVISGAYYVIDRSMRAFHKDRAFWCSSDKRKTRNYCHKIWKVGQLFLLILS